MNTEVEEFLEHYGKRGMRWGVRSKDRSNHGLNSRANKLQSLADRRPTRGNIRKAQRAQNVANRSANKTKLSSFVKKNKKPIAITAGALAAVGASYAAGRLAGGKGKIPISDMNNKVGKLLRDVGSNYANGVLKSNDRVSFDVIKNTARQIETGTRTLIR